MIRIQMYCFACKQIVDATVYAKKGVMMAASFENGHAFDTCFKEEPDGGQDQDSPGTVEADDGSADEAEAAEATPTTPQAKVH